jgi:hypothetical protein
VGLYLRHKSTTPGTANPRPIASMLQSWCGLKDQSALVMKSFHERVVEYLGLLNYLARWIDDFSCISICSAPLPAAAVKKVSHPSRDRA